MKLLFFFFSSRRRHTRSLRDWSSDVCSSDLVEREIEDLEAVIEAAGGSAYAFGHSSGGALALEATAAGAPISRLAIYEAPYIVDDSRPPLASDYIEHLEELVAMDKRPEVFEY